MDAKIGISKSMDLLNNSYRSMSCSLNIITDSASFDYVDSSNIVFLRSLLNVVCVRFYLCWWNEEINRFLIFEYFSLVTCGQNLSSLYSHRNPSECDQFDRNPGQSIQRYVFWHFFCLQHSDLYWCRTGFAFSTHSMVYWWQFVNSFYRQNR